MYTKNYFDSNVKICSSTLHHLASINEENELYYNYVSVLRNSYLAFFSYLHIYVAVINGTENSDNHNS